MRNVFDTVFSRPDQDFYSKIRYQKETYEAILMRGEVMNTLLLIQDGIRLGMTRRIIVLNGTKDR